MKINEANAARQQSPLSFAELRLRENCDIRLVACDESGARVQLEYKLIASPAGFDLARLRSAWARWRNQQGITCDDAS